MADDQQVDIGNPYDDVAEPEAPEVAVEAAEAPGDAVETHDVKEPEQKLVPYGAMKDERRKRQERDREIEALKLEMARMQGYVAAGQQQGGQPAEEDLYDEDAVYADLPGTLKKIEARAMSRIEQDRRAERYENSEILARHLHPDYDDKVEHFRSLAQKNPQLLDHMERHRSPAIFAYEAAKKDLDTGNDFETRLAETLEREKAKWMAEHAPQSLSTMRGSGQTAQPTSFEPESLKDILGR